ncbi:hypothetical protein [Trujillonella humicola]|uniref:hypothetical protein n=1 Tax=Trujillonella humicola TaxID=3383699 RepID=UPI0039060EF6
MSSWPERLRGQVSCSPWWVAELVAFPGIAVVGATAALSRWLVRSIAGARRWLDSPPSPPTASAGAEAPSPDAAGQGDPLRAGVDALARLDLPLVVGEDGAVLVIGQGHRRSAPRRAAVASQAAVPAVRAGRRWARSGTDGVDVVIG